jgi:hypothetical protein
MTYSFINKVFPGRNYPIGSYRIRRIPTESLVSDSGRMSESVGITVIPVGTLGIPTSDNFRSESDAKDSDNFWRIPVGSCRIIWGFLSDPTGSEF